LTFGKAMISFPSEIRIPVSNHLTGRRYDLVRAADLVADAETLACITGICNEPEVYDWLFLAPLGGKPYREEKARQWIERSKEGWQKGSHFVFAVIDEDGKVAAACDIKSNEPVAEIGYWASQQHRGVMTNAVSAMCLLAAGAGFRELYGRTRRGNVRSEAVLERAGFERTIGRSDDFEWFTLKLVDKGPNKALEPTPTAVTPRAIE
jgi:RimJ/RimL family protein N-acetyltransferase